jgi:hypothetical protein
MLAKSTSHVARFKCRNNLFMKNICLLFNFSFIIFLNLKASDTLNTKWQVLPQPKLVQTFTADSRASRLSFARNFDENSYNASMGGILPIIGVKQGKFNGQLSAAGSTYLTLKRANGGGSVVNTDFFAEVFLDASLSNYYYLRLGTGHSSQHLSDDAIVSGLTFTNYAKDYHYAGLIYKRQAWHLQAYGLAHYNYNFKTQTNLSGKWMLQLGFEHTALTINSELHFYYASDIKLKEELNFEPTINIQTGLKLGNEGQENMRLAFDQTWGAEERGSFMYEKRNFSRLGIYLDF